MIVFSGALCRSAAAGRLYRGTACSGEDALELCTDCRFGLVVTDLAMPGISGLELLVKIKSQDPSIDVILVTANADLESALFSLKHGARDFC
jgi:two-component system, cell cycle response regulator